MTGDDAGWRGWRGRPGRPGRTRGTRGTWPRFAGPRVAPRRFDFFSFSLSLSLSFYLSLFLSFSPSFSLFLHSECRFEKRENGASRSLFHCYHKLLIHRQIYYYFFWINIIVFFPLLLLFLRAVFIVYIYFFFLLVLLLLLFIVVVADAFLCIEIQGTWRGVLTIFPLGNVDFDKRKSRTLPHILSSSSSSSACNDNIFTGCLNCWVITNENVSDLNLKRRGLTIRRRLYRVISPIFCFFWRLLNRRFNAECWFEKRENSGSG